ncbi:TPA: VOC family protein [Streptococcus pyogenes]|nr:VOC family protein [Streptococcus pyogenes]
MKLNAIHHVAIIVSDYNLSKNFYVNKLGFEIIRENYRPDRHDYTGEKMTFFFDPDGLPLELHE